MTHFGIICPADTGHLNVMMPLGCELLRRGHRVIVVGFLDARSNTLASGLEFKPLAEDEFPLGSNAEEFTQRGKLSGLAALQHSLKPGHKRLDAILRDGPGQPLLNNLV
ncbi:MULTISPECIES: hypothetical protein [unclassified Microcoleus]|uniref:hypothetical protein n=1 Tax=unclassified Microcoleus TaxID=2642155 RepID=UPI002FD77657